MTVGIAILTLNAESLLPSCLQPLKQSALRPKILVVDSSSTDNTVSIAKEFGSDVLVIPRSEFNHGTTRELARKQLGTDVVVMLTPDAILTDESSLKHVVEPILTKRASIAYGRQIPHHSASFFEAFPRDFNYPAISQVRSIQDIKKYGVYTFFCSDSFAAYSNQALDSIGGFSRIIFGEDTIAVAKLLQHGHKIAYVAEAVVHHSHDYSLKMEFKRHFDIGYVRKQHHFLLSCQGSDNSRGVLYLKMMIKNLIKQKPHLLPYAILQTGVKWFGYQLGRRSHTLPRSIKRRLSSQPYYW